MKNTAKKLSILAITAALLCSLESCEQSAGKTPGINDTPYLVKTEKVEIVSDKSEIPYSGTIVESESIPLSFPVVGNISRVLVSEGDYVTKGETIAIMNAESYKNVLDMTIATEKRAEDAYNRLSPMYKNGNLPEIKFVEIETALQQAKSASAIAQKNLKDCNLVSPVDGVVGKRFIEPGMMAMPNITSISIVKIEKVFAKTPVSENEISKVKKGNKALIKVAALDGSVFTGTVEEIGVMADPISRTYTVKIGIQNKNRQLKPGMICNVILEDLNHPNFLCVPGSAVMVDEQGGNFVYVVNNNKAQKKFIKTGELLTKGIEVTEGLNSGDEVIITGQQKLADNSLIRIIN